MWNLQKSSVYFALTAQLYSDAKFSLEMLDLHLEMICIKIAIKNVDSKHYYYFFSSKWIKYKKYVSLIFTSVLTKLTHYFRTIDLTLKQKRISFRTTSKLRKFTNSCNNSVLSTLNSKGHCRNWKSTLNLSISTAFLQFFL